MKHMDRDKFLNLPTEEVAKHVRASGSKVVVFPINGTRRWFMLEYGHQEFDDPTAAYLNIATEKNIELYKLFFEHGIDTLLAPVIGPEILSTRDAYMQKIGADGLSRPVRHPDFLSLYEEYNVRVRFYGEYRKHLENTPYEHLIDLFEEISEKTRNNDGHRLFFGAFADDLQSTNTIANLTVAYYNEHSEIPDRKTLVEMYYGDYIEKADIFIGFDRFATFDYPLLRWGEEDLYFTVSPSPYIEKEQLRSILYDHLYTRRVKEPEHFLLSQDTIDWLRSYYLSNVDTIMGIGSLKSGIWLPTLPPTKI